MRELEVAGARRHLDEVDEEALRCAAIVVVPVEPRDQRRDP